MLCLKDVYRFIGSDVFIANSNLEVVVGLFGHLRPLRGMPACLSDGIFPESRKVTNLPHFKSIRVGLVCICKVLRSARCSHVINEISSV